jgi:hypothetical protein
MKCPKCNKEMKKIKIDVEDASSKVYSYQCKCGYFDFEKKSVNKAIKEIHEKETLLKIKQKIVKISNNRLGMYFNKDIIRSLNLQGGEEIYVSIPDKNKLLIEIG